MRSGDKAVNRMDRLRDMGHFPAVVHSGATANVLVTLAVTFVLQGWVTRHLLDWYAASIQPLAGDGLAVLALLARLQFWTQAAPFLWTGIVLIVNLAPVVLLRWRMGAGAAYPPLHSMSFWTDQHKFSSWVYLAASANMAFWINAGWLAFAWSHTARMLAAALAIAALATFSPVVLRGLKGRTR